MRRMIVLVVAVLAVGLIGYGVVSGQKGAPPFGGEEDVAFAEKLWKAMEGWPGWPMKSDFYTGMQPHGMVLRMYYGMVQVDGTSYHVVIKDNYGGEDATVDAVSAHPGKYLMAVTVMVQREAEYDPENGNWFWVKFNADGTLAKNDKEMMLAGRVAKGMPKGCIACHSGAGGDDFLFFNDGDAEASLDGEALLNGRCVKCHDLRRVDKAKKKKKDRADWEKIIDRMMKKGTKLDDAERDALIEYLVSEK